MTPAYSEEVITPEMAAEWLAHNTHNRAMKWSKVGAYADDIRDGRWRLNGEAIKFSSAGRLLDGQNRLQAVILAEKPIRSLVVRGLPDEAQETMDTGATRRLADVLALRGEQNTANLAAVVRAVYVWRNTDDPQAHRLGRASDKAALSNTMLLSYFDSQPDMLRTLAADTEGYRRKTRIPATVIAPLLYQMQQLDLDDAKDFWHRVERRIPSPSNFEERDPIIQLTQAIDRLMTQTRGYNATELGALIVKAWNAYRQGTPITCLRWRMGGSTPEAFPLFV